MIMGKCVNCGNELLTGDSHWEMGVCNKCYKKIEDKIRNARPVLIDMNEEKDQRIAELKKENKVLKRALELVCDWFMITGFLGDQIKTEFYINRAEKELGNIDES